MPFGISKDTVTIAYTNSDLNLIFSHVMALSAGQSIIESF